MDILLSSKNTFLDKFNTNLHKTTLKIKKKVEDKRIKKGYIDYENYNFNILKNIIFELLKNNNFIENLDDINLVFIDRNKFDGDLTLKLPKLIGKYHGSKFIKEIIPDIIELFNKSQLVQNGFIEKIEQKGIYINISLTDKYLYNSINQIFELADKFGENNLFKDKSIVIDYSAPNAAKHLHAGHIRSTIIGHVLSNLYEVNGYTSHRVNHINDWGGFGFLIHGLELWENKLDDFDSKNDMLFFIYKIYRKGEKASNSIEDFDNLSNEENKELIKYYGDFSNYNEFKILFEDFKNESNNRFRELEKGSKNEVEIWQKIVKWSLDDFNKFYELLGIQLDYTIGESFYSNMGRNIVLDYFKSGKIIFYNKLESEKDINELNNKFKNGDITEKAFNFIQTDILNDIGSYVVRLDNFERFVVLKENQSTIYSTRDLAAIKYRNDIFRPSRIVYEVGQEQSEHFDKLFKSSKIFGYKNIDYSHIFHGFYVNADSKKKLSSRDGASNVINLINSSIDYFKTKYKDNTDFSDKEMNDNAYLLAIGSIIFNDLRKDKKSPVLINNDINKTFETFEKSGGAYIMYSVARARSILRKYNKKTPELSEFNNINLENIEKILINEFNKYPLIIELASKKDNPAILTEYLLNLSGYYNSYYNGYRVLDEGNEYRLKILESFIQIVKNGMKILHINLPERI